MSKRPVCFQLFFNVYTFRPYMLQVKSLVSNFSVHVSWYQRSVKYERLWEVVQLLPKREIQDNLRFMC